MHFALIRLIEEGILELCLSFYSHTHNSDGFLMLVLHSDHTQIGLLRLKQTHFDFPFHFQLPDLKPDSCQADCPKEE